MKFIHIGRINSKSNTYFFLNGPRASIYAVGYAIIRQTSVVTVASAKLYKSVPSVFVLAKNETKLPKVNCPCPLVKA